MLENRLTKAKKTAIEAIKVANGKWVSKSLHGNHSSHKLSNENRVESLEEELIYFKDVVQSATKAPLTDMTTELLSLKADSSKALTCA